MYCRGRICCLTGEQVLRSRRETTEALTGCMCSRPVKSAQTLTAPVFRDGVLKVFRNTLTNDVRFHCKVDRESETYWSAPPPPDPNCLVFITFPDAGCVCV
jgi:hypothetical protein